jgi:hypothetical protein
LQQALTLVKGYRVGAIVCVVQQTRVELKERMLSFPLLTKLYAPLNNSTRSFWDILTEQQARPIDTFDASLSIVCCRGWKGLLLLGNG